MPASCPTPARSFTEANITLAVISRSDIPDPGAIDVDAPAYLNGMAEVIGELRRYILDALRRDSFEHCEEFMDVMDEIYGILVTIDFPEGVTGGLRRSTDAMRGVLERTPRRPDHLATATAPGAKAGGFWGTAVSPCPGQGRNNGHLFQQIKVTSYEMR